jgi:hypothetical protein
MAIEAGGGFLVVFAEEFPAMNAFGVNLELPGMALRAECRDFRFTCRRSRVSRRKDVMGPVAGLTGRRRRVSRGLCAAVDAHLVCAGLFRGGTFPAEKMADPAVDFGRTPVGKPGDIDMTLRAREKTMDRLFEEGDIYVTFHSMFAVAFGTGILGKSRRWENKT